MGRRVASVASRLHVGQVAGRSLNCPELEAGRPAYVACEALPILGAEEVDLLPSPIEPLVYPNDGYGSPFEERDQPVAARPRPFRRQRWADAC